MTFPPIILIEVGPTPAHSRLLALTVVAANGPKVSTHPFRGGLNLLALSSRLRFEQWFGNAVKRHDRVIHYASASPMIPVIY